MPTISKDRWQEISPYLDSVLSLPEDERSAWLAAFHYEKPDLAQSLTELLQEHAVLTREGFLAGQPTIPVETSFAGETVGAYRLISRIGEGGMGSVWLAERSDGRFERKVAIKFLRFSLASQSSTERFKREGRILGQLANPHIAELIDAGVSATGQPYIVLEHIDGEPIDAYCDRHCLDVQARIRLFLDVLSAVSHAHASLVVHRDIKPSNVLVRADGCVKLLDFGIAKLLADDAGSGTETQLTIESGGALTPQYAAPEQVTSGAITTATDVYTLGALLYLLLTGRHPTCSGTLSPAELVKAITETEPLPPSDASISPETAAVAGRRATTPEKLHRLLRGDLDTIITKALKKKPAERYKSVNACADDLQRFLNHQPISARPDSFAYRAHKFVRRNSTAVALSTIAFVAACAGVVGILVQTHNARDQRDFAFRQVMRANSVSDIEDFVLADAAPNGKPFTVDDLLGRAEKIITRERSENNIDRVALLISIGRQYLGEDEDAKAGLVLKRAYDLSRNLSDVSVRAQASCAWGSLLARTGEPSRGEDMVQAGLRELPDQPQYVLDRVYCLSRGREVADHNGAGQLAIDRILEAIRIRKASPFDTQLMEWRAEMDLAEAFRENGQYRQAVKASQRSFELMSELGRDDTQSAGTLLNNWALALEFCGEPLEAEKIFYRAIQLSRNLQGDTAVSPGLLLNYARVLKELARNSEAEDYANRAQSAAVKSGDDVIVNQTLIELARIYRQEGKLSRSDAMLDEVEPRLRKNLPPGHYAFAAIASERELNALEAGHLEAANDFAKQAFDILQATLKKGNSGVQFMPALLGRQSRLELKLGHAEKAADLASEQLSILQSTVEPGQYSSNLGYAYLNLARAFAAQGKPDQAQIAFRSASEYLERTLGPGHPDSLSALQSAGLKPR